MGRGKGNLTLPRESLPGRERPKRPCPPDFVDRYLEMGWNGIVEHYATNWPCICRWVDESGGDDLRQARAARVKAVGRKPALYDAARTDRGFYRSYYADRERKRALADGGKSLS